LPIIGVLGRRVGARQQHADHHAHLRLVAMAGADDRFLHHVRRVLGDAHAGLPRDKEGNAARLTELQGCGRVLVDERRLHRRLGGPELLDHAPQAVMDGNETFGQRGALVGLDRAARDERQAVAGDVEHAPAGAAEARIDAEDANRMIHRAH
jgi:hypothetical protein